MDPNETISGMELLMCLKPHSLLLRGTRAPYRARQNPRARQIIENHRGASDVRDTPAAQILIERGGEVEHVPHVRDVTGACGRQGRVLPCINKRVDLSFRSLGVCDASHMSCIAYTGRRANDRHAVWCEEEQ